ncbi:GTPase ObgE [bacterium (Candidatus Gribaldobacteria) CG07_land_8_20_14_0_80_33_18]|uniref:GTPase Obg n=1 Tax=bacterium (Candidatus Gribaldobacteria) CG07_land_8_20_14_0_80_33_18 TaxID=2014272 RepID=A0A2M6Z2E3_9BACT|nr:MAG: GTPase ObgE [bacterium (Candidatus Gribaldobacteria) CG07_land_8_20_14_0_80_33_18]PJB08117.1 MAG: GTPase ObgE [bacterium (Candidatus Gribaldobacteria) CG_4_9_14_3_um_filter_33_9]
MLIDDVKIRAVAGSGGKGAVSFNKNLMSLGPVGGSGGRGGSIYVEGVSDLSALNQFRFKKEIKAKDGQDGRSQFRDGNNAEDLVLLVPVGTVVHNLKINEDLEITKIGQRILFARGGRGGKGNFHFRSAINTTPKEFEYGEPGESFEVRFELKLIADVGFIGLPNVGKSSLLNELTNAKSKVANYSFTTLEPNLGAYYDLILADIPGLIEGASKGKGLGIKFLRHIERTKILFHFVAADSIDSVVDYKTVRGELGAYNKLLLEKPEYLFISKKDAVSPDIVAEVAEKLKKLNKNATPISIFDWDSIELVRKILNDLILEKYEI